MRSKKVICCIIGLVCVFSLSVGAVYAVTNGFMLKKNDKNNKYYLAGQYYNSMIEDGNIKESNDVKVVAKYKAHSITSTVVTYQRNMNVLRSGEAAKKYDSNLDVVNQIIENIMITEEAERLGLSATEEEIKALVQSSVNAYSLPEGKEMMDAYCEGAGITIEEYFLALEEQAPGMIARQNLKDEIGRQFCIENGLEFRKFNPPDGVTEAQDTYIAALFERNKDDIVYYLDGAEVS